MTSKDVKATAKHSELHVQPRSQATPRFQNQDKDWTNTTSWTINGGLGQYVMWTRFGNDGNVPTQYAASTASYRTVKFALSVSANS